MYKTGALRKLAAIMLAVVMLCTIAACSSGSTDSNVSTKEASGTETASATPAGSTDNSSGTKPAAAEDTKATKTEAPTAEPTKPADTTVAASSKATPAQVTEKAAVPALDKNARLTVWFSTYRQECAEMQKIAKEFTNETGIKVTVAESVVLTLRNRLPTSAKSSVRPDIMLMQSADIGVMSEYLKPVEWLDDATKDKLYPIAVEGMKYKGKLYGLGYSADAYGIVYNKKLIKELPKTWSEYFAAAEKMNQKDASGNYTLQGTIINPSNYWFMYPVIRNYGGYFLGKNSDGSYNPKDIGLNNAGAVAAAQKLLELKSKGLTTMSYTEIETNISTKFAQGKIAMMIYGLWQARDYTRAGIDYGYAPLPKNDNGTVSMPLSTIQGFVVNKFSKWPNEAEAFVKFIMKDENQQRLYEAANEGNNWNGQRNTCSKAVYNSKYTQSSELLKSLAEVSLIGEVFPPDPEANVVFNNTTRDAYDAIFYNGKDVKATLDELVATIKKDIANMRK